MTVIEITPSTIEEDVITVECNTPSLISVYRVLRDNLPTWERGAVIQAAKMALSFAKNGMTLTLIRH